MVGVHLAYKVNPGSDDTITRVMQALLSSHFHYVHSLDWRKLLFCVMEYDGFGLVQFYLFNYLENKQFSIKYVITK